MLLNIARRCCGLVIGGYVSFRMVLCCVFLSALAESFAASEPSAQEIMDKCQKAMQSSLKYHLDANGVRTVVYQKVSTNGEVMSRVETSGRIPIVTLIHASGMVQLFPEYKVAIDQGFLKELTEQLSQNQTRNLSALMGNISAKTAELMGLKTQAGQTCYEIGVSIPPDLVAKMRQSAGSQAANLVPDRCQYLVETNSFMVLEIEQFSHGHSVSKMEYNDIELLTNVADAYFEVPAGYQVEKPANLQDYVKTIAKYVAPPPKNIPKGFAIDPKTQMIAKVDPKTGALVPLPGDTGENGAAVFGGSNEQKRIRLIILSILVVSSLGFVVAIARSQRARRKTG